MGRRYIGWARELARAGWVAVLLTGVAASMEAVTVRAAAPVQLRLWHYQAGPLGTALEEEIQRFNASHPGIVIRPEFVGDANALHQKLMAAVAGGSPPELSQAMSVYIPAYLDAGAVVPVERFFSGPGGLSREELADFVPAALELATFEVDGRPTVVGWPFNLSLPVLYYNQEMLQAAGVAVPKTWEEFRRAAVALTQPGKRWGWAWTPGLEPYLALFWSNGGELLTAGGRQVGFDGPVGIEALKFLTQLCRVDRACILTRAFDWQYELINERAALATSTIVSRVYIEKDLGGRFTLGMAPLPAGRVPRTQLYGASMLIFKTTPERERAAWEFLKWWGAPEQTARWAIKSGYLPVRFSAAQVPAYRETLQRDPRLQVGFESLKFAQAEPTLRSWSQIRNFLSEAISAAVLGQSTPEAALRQAAARANRLLATEAGGGR